MTTLTKYFENEALNEALNTTSDDKFYGQKGFRLVEMRDDSLISDRNHAALYACKIILALNSEVKMATGTPFLRRRYNLNIRFNQMDITELELLMADFDNCFEEAVEELRAAI